VSVVKEREFDGDIRTIIPHVDELNRRWSDVISQRRGTVWSSVLVSHVWC